jgi:hypothetical protein
MTRPAALDDLVARFLALYGRPGDARSFFVKMVYGLAGTPFYFFCRGAGYAADLRWAKAAMPDGGERTLSPVWLPEFDVYVDVTARHAWPDAPFPLVLTADEAAAKYKLIGPTEVGFGCSTTPSSPSSTGAG